MIVNCVVCERSMTEHPLLKNVYYCSNQRCTRLGLLSVFVLEKKEVKDDQNIPQPGSK